MNFLSDKTAPERRRNLAILVAQAFRLDIPPIVELMIGWRFYRFALSIIEATEVDWIAAHSVRPPLLFLLGLLNTINDTYLQEFIGASETRPYRFVHLCVTQKTRLMGVLLFFEIIVIIQALSIASPLLGELIVEEVRIMHLPGAYLTGQGSQGLSTTCLCSALKAQGISVMKD